MKKKNDWIDLAPLDAVPRRGARCVKAPGGRIAVFRTEDDRIFATEDKCPHAGGPLSQGIVHGASVTCPLHNWVIDLESGAVAGPDEGRARTVPVRVEDGRILMAAAPLSSAAE
ncbi:MAG: nitrite reductase small subunit NirD [Rhodobiaceae bacterium]|nr:nitrite reductase small subunit NirD [Rhodobiaceae bacterium]